MCMFIIKMCRKVVVFFRVMKGLSEFTSKTREKVKKARNNNKSMIFVRCEWQPNENDNVAQWCYCGKGRQHWMLKEEITKMKTRIAKATAWQRWKRAPTKNFQTVKPFERSYKMTDTPLIRPLVTASIVLPTVASYNFRSIYQNRNACWQNGGQNSSTAKKPPEKLSKIFALCISVHSFCPNRVGHIWPKWWFAQNEHCIFANGKFSDKIVVSYIANEWMEMNARVWGWCFTFETE